VRRRPLGPRTLWHSVGTGDSPRGLYRRTGKRKAAQGIPKGGSVESLALRRDPVSSLSRLVLRRLNLQLHLLRQLRAEEATDAMVLPTALEIAELMEAAAKLAKVRRSDAATIRNYK